jgi:hypothetical protein
MGRMREDRCIRFAGIIDMYDSVESFGLGCFWIRGLERAYGVWCRGRHGCFLTKENTQMKQLLKTFKFQRRKRIERKEEGRNKFDFSS